MGTLTVDLAECVVFTSTTEYASGQIRPKSGGAYTDFVVAYEVDPAEDFTLEVDFLGGDNSAATIRMRMWATEQLDGNGDSFIDIGDVYTATNSVLDTPYTLSATWPAHSPSAWASAEAIGPIFIEVYFARSIRVTGVRVTQDSIAGGDPDPTYVGSGDGFDFGVDADVITTPTFDPLDMVPLSVVAVAVPIPAGFANGVPL